MPTEEPSFSSKPLNESGDEDVKQKKFMKRKRESKKTEAATAQTKLSRQLTQIYQDNEGHLPDMKKIKIKKSHPALKTLFILLFLGGLLSAVAWAGFFLMPNDKKFSENQVNLTINGPKTVVSGATTTYTISYKNNQDIVLKKATLNVQYPKGFIFLNSSEDSKNSGHTEWALGELKANAKAEITITGFTYGSLNQQQSWRVFLTYQPENFGSELQKTAILEVTIEKSPFSLAVSGPSKTLIGNAAEYTFTVKKEEKSQINKLELKPSLPANFFITSSSPALSKDNKWVIEPNKITSSSPEGAASWIFKITGKFSSSTAASADISAALFTSINNTTVALTDIKTTTELTQNDLDFNLAINGSLSNFNSQPGENLNITISLKNQSTNDLKTATVKLTLNAPSAKKQSLLDWTKIEDKYDGDIRGTQLGDNLRRGEITWNKDKISGLAKINKNQELSIDVRLPIKDNSSFDLSSLNNSAQITALAEINFKDKDGITHTYSSNQIVITVNSDLKFETRDSVSSVGSAQKHQITWVLTNNFHPLKNLILSADVYGDVKVDLTLPAPAGEVKFDTANKKITWTIPEMPGSVDTLALPFIITLNTVNPTQQLLVSKVHVQADDTVTGQKLDFMGEATTLR